MANLCSFTARVTTLTAEEMKKVFDVVLDYGRYCSDLYCDENGHCGERDEDFKNYDYESLKNTDGTYQGTFNGCCSWAVNGCFSDELLKVSGETHSYIEVFADEEGVGFQEHYIFENGTMICSDCEDWSRYNYEDFIDEYCDDNDCDREEVEELNEKTLVLFNQYRETNFTLDDFDEDGYAEVGGFENYLEFGDVHKADLESYHNQVIA